MLEEICLEEDTTWEELEASNFDVLEEADIPTIVLEAMMLSCLVTLLLLPYSSPASSWSSGGVRGWWSRRPRRWTERAHTHAHSYCHRRLVSTPEGRRSPPQQADRWPQDTFPARGRRQHRNTTLSGYPESTDQPPSTIYSRTPESPRPDPTGPERKRITKRKWNNGRALPSLYSLLFSVSIVFVYILRTISFIFYNFVYISVLVYYL